jgi:competence protein ComEA
MPDKQEIVPETLTSQPADSLAPSPSSPSPSTHQDSEPEDQAGLLATLPDFRVQHRSLLRICMGILLIILSVQWITVALQRPEPLKLHRGDTFRQQFRVDVNHSTWVEWMQLEGIGISMAHRIVADRTLNGPFHSIDEVARVPGIGDTTLDQIRPWLTMGHDLSTPQSLESTQNVTDEQQALDRKPSPIRGGENLRRQTGR